MEVSALLRYPNVTIDIIKAAFFHERREDSKMETSVSVQTHKDFKKPLLGLIKNPER